MTERCPGCGLELSLPRGQTRQARCERCGVRLRAHAKVDVVNIELGAPEPLRAKGVRQRWQNNWAVVLIGGAGAIIFVVVSKRMTAGTDQDYSGLIYILLPVVFLIASFFNRLRARSSTLDQMQSVWLPHIGADLAAVRRTMRERAHGGNTRRRFWIVFNCVAAAALAAFIVWFATWWSSHPDRMLGLLGWALIACAVACIGNAVRLGMRDSKASANQVRSRDPRRPIVYVRSFADDDLNAVDRAGDTFLGNSAYTFEHGLSQSLRGLGPFVAIGEPGRGRPTGAARSYFDGDSWRGEVQSLFGEALCIVAVAGSTPGLVWELEQLTKGGHAHKTVVLFPSTRHAVRCDWLRHVFRETAEGKALAAANLSRACAVAWSRGGQLIVFNALPAGVGAYEAALDVVLFNLLSA